MSQGYSDGLQADRTTRSDTSEEPAHGAEVGYPQSRLLLTCLLGMQTVALPLPAILLAFQLIF